MVSTSNKTGLLGFFDGGCRAALSRARNRVVQLLSDRRGVAAIEFAFVAPLLLMTYLASMEISLAIEASKKVGRAGSMVADLIAQQPTMSKAEIEAIMAIGGSILQPYNRSGLTIIVTAIAISNESTPQVKVAWSRMLEKGEPKAGVAAGTATTVPEKLKIAGSFLVKRGKRSGVQAGHRMVGQPEGFPRSRRRDRGDDHEGHLPSAAPDEPDHPLRRLL